MAEPDHIRALHLKVSNAAQRYHDIGETEPFPRAAWIDAWNDLKGAIKTLREAEKDACETPSA